MSNIRSVWVSTKSQGDYSLDLLFLSPCCWCHLEFAVLEELLVKMISLGYTHTTETVVLVDLLVALHKQEQ